MNQTTLRAEVRDATGKGVARKLRAEKKIPAIIYGPYMDAPITVAVEPKQLRAAAQGPRRLNTLLTLDLGVGKAKVALPKDYQQHPVTRELLHADFYEVQADKPVTATVPVVLKGRAPGVALGGVIAQNRRTVDVECLPGAIPDAIEVDVSKMEFNDVIHVADVPTPEGVKIRYLTNFSLAVLSAPEGLEEEKEEE
jgi:large subunit ribosomal protein L25